MICGMMADQIFWNSSSCAWLMSGLFRLSCYLSIGHLFFFNKCIYFFKCVNSVSYLIESDVTVGKTENMIISSTHTGYVRPRTQHGVSIFSLTYSHFQR